MQKHGVESANESKNMCSSKSTKKLKLVQVLMDYELAKHICQILDAEMYMPETKTELDGILNKSNKGYYLFERCKSGMIVPIYQNDNGDWVDNKQTVVTSTLQWDILEPNGGALQRCVQLNSNFNSKDFFCTSTGCAICKWTRNPVFLLKGKDNIQGIILLLERE